jgi:DNA-binding NarL/FixJ family response regulator
LLPDFLHIVRRNMSDVTLYCTVFRLDCSLIPNPLCNHSHEGFVNTGADMNQTTTGMTTDDVARVLRVVADWTAALQGAGDLGRAADLLLALLPASHVCLLRTSTKTNDVSRIYASKATPPRDIDIASVMAVWKEGCVTLQSGANRAIIALYHHADQRDVLDIGFCQTLDDQQRSLLDLLAYALSDAWSRRQPGLISGRIVDLARRNRPSRDISAKMPILDYSNPYALSRSEFRVCTMIGQGLTAKRIARELRLSEATVRSHQRAIYNKTELRGQIEVMFHLQSHPTAQSLMREIATMAAC